MIDYGIIHIDIKGDVIMSGLKRKHKASKKVWLAWGLSAVLLSMILIAVYTGVLEGPKTSVSHNGVEIAIDGADYETELYNDTLYFYIPINEDLDRNDYTLKVRNEEQPADQVDEFFSNIDTLIPGEILHEFSLYGETLKVSVIVE